MCQLPNACNRQRYWQPRLIEHWLGLDQQVRKRKKIEVVSGFFSPSNVPSSRKGKGRASSKENREIHLVSSVAEVIISGDSVLNDSRKDVAKEVKMDLARFTWEQLGV